MHRKNGFARFFHRFISVLHSGHTSKPQFFHCFSSVSRVLYAIMVPHRSLNFSIVFPSHQFPSFYSYFTWYHFRPTSEPQFFHCFSIVLLHFFIIAPRFFHCFSIANGLTSKPQFFPLLFHSFTQHHFPLHSSLPSVFFTIFPPILLNRPIVYARSLSIYPSISSIFAVFCHGVTRFLHHYPYVTSVCLTLTQIHLPQSLPLHRINGFARFFHGFISVLLLHSGHTAKPQFFHCFSIVSRVLYAIMVPHRSLNFSIVFPSHQFPSFYSYFTWHHFPSVLLNFSIVLPLF